MSPQSIYASRSCGLPDAIRGPRQVRDFRPDSLRLLVSICHLAGTRRRGRPDRLVTMKRSWSSRKGPGDGSCSEWSWTVQVFIGCSFFRRCRVLSRQNGEHTQPGGKKEDGVRGRQACRLDGLHRCTGHSFAGTACAEPTASTVAEPPVAYRLVECACPRQRYRGGVGTARVGAGLILESRDARPRCVFARLLG